MPTNAMPKGLAGFLAARQQGQQEETAELQQAGALQALLAGRQQQQERALAAQKARAYEADLAKLGEGATPEQHIGIARKYLGPKELVDLTGREQDRKTQREIQRQAAEDRRDNNKALIDARYDALAQQTANEDQKRALEALRIEEKAAADKRHDATLQMLGILRADVAANRPTPQPQIIQTESGPMQVNREGRATPIVGPDGKPVAPRATEKALPTSAAQKLFENQTNLRRAETALALMEGKDVGEMKGDADATGWKGFVPDAMLQRLDPKGIDARAALADLGSLIIHERSGAAVTAAEFPRLQPFIPKINDDPDTVKKKLKRFAQIYRDVASETANFYKESGYKVPELKSVGVGSPAPSGGTPKVTSDAEYDALPSGTVFVGPDGKTRKKP